MKYDFDKEINRKNTQSLKWSMIQEKDSLRFVSTDCYFAEDRTLPMWVADMDFPSPIPVVDALEDRAAHGIYGYTVQTQAYDQAVVKWMKDRHGWNIEPEWICITPGVVPALNLLVQTFSRPGQKVLVQRPVYYPFFSAIENNGCKIVSNSLVLKNGRYVMDFHDLEQKAADPDVSMCILCSPHNPVGRVWSLEELSRFGTICMKHNVLIIADEIHADLIYRGYSFTPFATVRDDFARNAVICTSASKTFNLAGLHTSNIIIADAKLRSRFCSTLKRCGLLGAINSFGAIAGEVAYTHGHDWLNQLLAYLESNLEFLTVFLSNQIPQIRVIKPEGTYLAWLDCRDLGLDKWELKKLMLNKAKIFFDEGFIFGPEGEGFERINIACPRSILEQAMERLKRAVKG